MRHAAISRSSDSNRQIKTTNTHSYGFFSKLILFVFTVLLFIGPDTSYGDIEFAGGITARIDYTVDGSVWIYDANVMMVEPAHILGFVVTGSGAVLDIYGGQIDYMMLISTSDDTLPEGQVTVYGTDFAVDGVPVPPGTPELFMQYQTLSGVYEDGTPFSYIVDCVIEGNANYVYYQTVKLGWVVSEPDIQISQNDYDFGGTDIGTTQNGVLTVYNLGNEALTIQSLEILQDQDIQFTFTPFEVMPLTLAPNTALDIEIAYKPVREGPAQAMFRVLSNDPDQPVLQVALSGTGLSVVNPDFTVEKVCLTDPVSPGRIALFEIEITNTGDTDLDFLINDPAAGIVDTIIGPIAPGSNCINTVDVSAECTNGSVGNTVTVEAFYDGVSVGIKEAFAECPCASEPSQEVTQISECRIQNNSAQQGGGIYCIENAQIRNCLITNNSASVNGGGLHVNALVNLFNSTIAYNTAPDGRDLMAMECMSTISNSIIWGQPGQLSLVNAEINISYSNIQGGSSAVILDPNSVLNWDSGNVDLIPDFIFAPRGRGTGIGGDEDVVYNYRLLAGSPCIDMGDPNYVPVLDETDLNGNSRVVNGRIDIGAYEYQESRIDLLITSEDMAFNPVPADPGLPATVSATVWNTGYTSTENISVTFTDMAGPIGSEVIPLLNPDQAAIVSIEYAWSEDSYQMITINVDPANAIDETDETNNTASKVYQIGNPEDANAILDVTWNSPSCYVENTSQAVQGRAVYRIGNGVGLDIVTPAIGSIVTAQMIVNGNVTNLQSTLTGTDGYFYIPFIVPSVVDEAFTIDIAVTDGTLTGILEKAFCIIPDNTPIDDLWVCGLSLTETTVDVGVPVSVCADICASPANTQLFENVPVNFYAYPPSGGLYLIGSTSIAQIAAGQTQTVCVNWTPVEGGKHRIRASIGVSDANAGNNYKYLNDIQVGQLNVTASPRWATLGDVVTITVDSREPLPLDQLAMVEVIDSSFNPIELSLVEHVPASTRWMYQTIALPEGTTFGQARIEVVADDPNMVYQGYFYVFETLPNFWLGSCDITPEKLNPSIAEPIGISAVVHAASSNPLEAESISVPVTFYSKHMPTDSAFIKVGQTQYTGGITAGDVSDPISVSWQNAGKGEYIIKAVLEPDFSDKQNWDNSATRAVLVGDEIPFIVEFEVINKTRVGRTTFDYECNVIMHNQTGLTLDNVQLELTGLPNNMTVVNPGYIAVIGSIGPNGSAVAEGTCTLRVDRSDPIVSAQINWSAVYQIVDTCGLMQQMSTSMVQLEEAVPGDITGEGVVGFEDLRILAEQWLQAPGIPSADIAPPPDGDGKVNMLDFALMAENWMK